MDFESASNQTKETKSEEAITLVDLYLPHYEDKKGDVNLRARREALES